MRRNSTVDEEPCPHAPTVQAPTRRPSNASPTPTTVLGAPGYLRFEQQQQQQQPEQQQIDHLHATITNTTIATSTIHTTTNDIDEHSTCKGCRLSDVASTTTAVPTISSSDNYLYDAKLAVNQNQNNTSSSSSSSSSSNNNNNAVAVSNNNTRNKSPSFSYTPPTIVKLNIGGKIFMTTSDTLTRSGCDENYFSALLSGKIPSLRDEDGCYFIDRDGKLFAQILNYLRTGRWMCSSKYDEQQVLDEARFYCIEPTIYSTITDAYLTEAVVASQRLATQKLYQQHRKSFDGLQAWFLPEFLRQANEGKSMPHVYLFDSESSIMAALPQRTIEISRIEEIAVQQGTIDYIRQCLRKNPQYRFSSEWKKLLSDSVTRDAFLAELRNTQAISVAINNHVYLGAVREQESIRAAEPEPILPGCQDCINHGALTAEYLSTWCIGVCSWPANKPPEQVYGTLFWKKNGLVIYWDAAKHSFPRDYIAQECGKFKRGKYNHAHAISTASV
jgi:hypothetical protein